MKVLIASARLDAFAQLIAARTGWAFIIVAAALTRLAAQCVAGIGAWVRPTIGAILRR
jgi:hypothetical protein